MNQVDIFLDLYNTLEQTLKGKSRYYNNRYESPIVRFQNSSDGKVYRDELESIRDIRNLLVHNPLIGGKEIVSPSDEVLGVLREIIEKVENPKTAIDFATHAMEIMTTTLNEDVYEVMRKMELNGFSHLPVMENSRMMGVFSKGTVFTYLVKNGLTSLENKMQIRAFKDLLPVRNHSSEFYEFTEPDTTHAELINMFDASYTKKSRRLAAIFVTENSNPTAPLLGMITPWDVLGRKD